MVIKRLDWTPLTPGERRLRVWSTGVKVLVWVLLFIANRHSPLVQAACVLAEIGTIALLFFDLPKLKAQSPNPRLR